MRGGVIAGRLVTTHGVDHRLGALADDHGSLHDMSDDDLVGLEAHDVLDLELGGLRVDPAVIGDLPPALRVERRLGQLDGHAAVGELAAGAQDGEDLETLVADERRRQGGELTLELLELARAGVEGTGALSRARTPALLLHQMLEAFLVDAHVPLGGDLPREVEGESIGVVQLERDFRGQFRAGVAGTPERLVEDTHPLLQRVAEARLFLEHDAFDVGAHGDELRVGGTHALHDFRGKVGEERLVDADGHALLDGAADDAPQHVVAAVVAREHAVHDHERGASRVLGHRAQRPGDGRRRRGLHACQLRGTGDQRREGVAVEDVGDALRDGGDALDAHAGVDTRLGQQRQLAGLVHLVLDEDQVPVLEETVAVAAGRTGRVVAAHARAEIVVELRTGPARPGRARGPPEVVLAPEAHDALRGEAVRLPQLHGFLICGHLVVAAEHAHPYLLAVDAELVRELERQAMASFLK